MSPNDEKKLGIIEKQREIQLTPIIFFPSDLRGKGQEADFLENLNSHKKGPHNFPLEPHRAEIIDILVWKTYQQMP